MDILGRLESLMDIRCERCLLVSCACAGAKTTAVQPPKERVILVRCDCCGHKMRLTAPIDEALAS